MQARSLIAPLTRQAIAVSRAVAAYLRALEQRDGKLRGADPTLLTPRDLLAAVPESWRSGDNGLRAALAPTSIQASGDSDEDDPSVPRDPAAALELRWIWPSEASRISSSTLSPGSISSAAGSALSQWKW